MKLLFLMPQLPYPAHQGTALRNFHILRGLARENSIDLLAFADVAGSVVPVELTSLAENVEVIGTPQRSMNRRLLQLLSTSRPDMALRLASTSYSEALSAMLRGKQYDIVQVEGIELAWTIPVIRQEAPQVALVYDAHNAEARLQERAGEVDRGSIKRLPAALYSQLQSKRLARYEAWVCREADGITAVSEADRDALLELSGVGRDKITVIPNCIDVAAYEEQTNAAQDQIEFDVLFSGKMDYRPNVDAVLWFADEIWPLIREAQPAATWAIVGQRPHARLARLSSMPGVTVTGWVPEIQPYLAGAAVFVMPFRVGSGSRLKLIEALAAGKGIVSTRVGVEGFPVESGKQLLLADAAAAFAEYVVTLMLDAKMRQRLGKQGREFARQYDWRVVVPRFQEIYDRLIAEH